MIESRKVLGRYKYKTINFLFINRNKSPSSCFQVRSSSKFLLFRRHQIVCMYNVQDTQFCDIDIYVSNDEPDLRSDITNLQNEESSYRPVFDTVEAHI